MLTITEKRFLADVIYTEEEYANGTKALGRCCNFDYNIVGGLQGIISNIKAVIGGYFYEFEGDVYITPSNFATFLNLKVENGVITLSEDNKPKFSDTETCICRKYIDQFSGMIAIDNVYSNGIDVSIRNETSIRNHLSDTTTAHDLSGRFDSHNTDPNSHLDNINAKILTHSNSVFAHGLKDDVLAIGQGSYSSNQGFAFGFYAQATGAQSSSFGPAANAKHSGSSAFGANAETTATNQLMLGSVGSTTRVAGSLSTAGTKQFIIDHPNPQKKDDYYLVHSCVETNTAGDNLYRYTIEAKKDDDVVVIDLPDYFSYLNTNVQIFTTAETSYAGCFGIYSEEKNTVEVHCEKVGEYSVMVIGTRKDDHPSVRNFKEEILKEDF